MKKDKKIIQIWVDNQFLEDLDDILKHLSMTRSAFIVEAIRERVLSVRDRYIRSGIIKKERETEFDKKQRAKEDKYQNIIKEFDDVIIMNGVETAVKYMYRGTPEEYISDTWATKDIRTFIENGGKKK